MFSIKILTFKELDRALLVADHPNANCLTDIDTNPTSDKGDTLVNLCVVG